MISWRVLKNPDCPALIWIDGELDASKEFVVVQPLGENARDDNRNVYAVLFLPDSIGTIINEDQNFSRLFDYLFRGKEQLWDYWWDEQLGKQYQAELMEMGYE